MATTTASATLATAHDIREWIRTNETRLFLEGKTLQQGKNDFELSTQLRTTHEKFGKEADECVKVWLVKVKSRTKNLDLDNAGWNRLKEAVCALLPELQGLRIDQAELVIRTRVSCNTQLLRGLPKRLQVWQ